MTTKTTPLPQKKTAKTIFANLNAVSDLNPTIVDFKELRKLFREALKQHDFFYDFSDDISVWRRGKYESDTLKKVVAVYERLLPVWNIYLKQRTEDYNKGTSTSTNTKNEEKKEEIS